MADDVSQTARDDSAWPENYFNYFTEIEERFRAARGTGLFLLSPLDWALIESWKNAGVPLEAVLQGIDAAFEKWRSRKVRRQNVNSLAYCGQAVADAAARSASPRAAQNRGTSPFSDDELRTHLLNCSRLVAEHGGEVFEQIANSLKQLSSFSETPHLEELEQRLSALEDKLVAAARTLQTEEELFQMRASLDRDLSPYRGKMTADQLAMLERRYLDTAVLDRAKLPRLSLFYLH
jgi:hypothetical protein